MQSNEIFKKQAYLSSQSFFKKKYSVSLGKHAMGWEAVYFRFSYYSVQPWLHNTVKKTAERLMIFDYRIGSL